MPNNYTKNIDGCTASMVDHYSACGMNNPVISLEYMLLEHRIKQHLIDNNSDESIAEAITTSLLEEGWQLPECSSFAKVKSWLNAVEHFVSELDDDETSQLVCEAKTLMDS